jgi:hypothetical protein
VRPDTCPSHVRLAQLLPTTAISPHAGPPPFSPKHALGFRGLNRRRGCLRSMTLAFSAYTGPTASPDIRPCTDLITADQYQC